MKKKDKNWFFFFLNQQNFIINQISAQGEQRPLKHEVQTKGVVYKRNTRKQNTNKDTPAINTHKNNTHQNKQPHLKLTPKETDNDIHNTHRHYSPQKNTLVKENPIFITKTEPHPPFLKINQPPPPHKLRSTERTPTKAQNQT